MNIIGVKTTRETTTFLPVNPHCQSLILTETKDLDKAFKNSDLMHRKLFNKSNDMTDILSAQYRLGRKNPSYSTTARIDKP